MSIELHVIGDVEGVGLESGLEGAPGVWSLWLDRQKIAGRYVCMLGVYE